MSATIYAKPSDNVSPDATWSVTAGTADSNYPVSAVKNLNPDDPTKSTGTSYTIRATFGGSQTVKIVQFLQHNLAGRTITITNNAGLSTTLIPAANGSDGFPEFSWKDLRTDPNNAATQWNFAVTVASGVVWIGEIVLWENARVLPVKWGLSHGVRRRNHTNKTDWGKKLTYQRGIRERLMSGELIDNDYRTAVFDLEADAIGDGKDWPLILEDTVQDSMWVRFTEDTLEVMRSAPNISPLTINVEETGLGLAP